MKAFQSKPYDLLLLKAERFIHSAETMLMEKDYDSAASRLYYAMLFIAQALLQELGLSFSSHRATISAFGQRFAKTRELDPSFHKALLDAFDQRQLGYYAVESGLSMEDIEILLNAAKGFLTAGREWLESKNHKHQNHAIANSRGIDREPR